jgi:hypothetical protein
MNVEGEEEDDEEDGEKANGQEKRAAESHRVAQEGRGGEYSGRYRGEACGAAERQWLPASDWA